MADSPFTFPASTLDLPSALLSALGSLWADTYGGNGLVLDLAAAKLAQQRQAFADGRELLDSVGRETCPVLHAELWYELTLAESGRNDADYSLARFGDAGESFGRGPLQWGVPEQRPLYAWRLPADVVELPLLFNRVTDASRTLVGGVDYVVRDGHVVFRDDPFADPLVPKAAVLADNVQIDRTLTLWACRAGLDRRGVYRQFGYALGADLPSTDAARELVNALYDALVVGSTGAAVRRAWSAVTGVPLVRHDRETVEAVVAEPGRTLVITDREVYAFDPSAAVTVAAGDAVRAGDPLTDALTFHEFNRGRVPEGLAALTLGRGVLAAGFFGDLAFEDRDVPLAVAFDEDGYARLSWHLAGWPGDVEAFFDDLHARGRARGRTLAHLLDRRPPAARDTEPTANALPATINPLRFLCENVLRDNAFLVRVRPGAYGTGGVGMEAAKFMRRVVPPQTAMIVAVELEYADDAVIMDGPGGPTRPGYEESLGTFPCASLTETVGPEMVTEDMRLYQVGGRCV